MFSHVDYYLSFLFSVFRTFAWICRFVINFLGIDCSCNHIFSSFFSIFFLLACDFLLFVIREIKFYYRTTTKTCHRFYCKSQPHNGYEFVRKQLFSLFWSNDQSQQWQSFGTIFKCFFWLSDSLDNFMDTKMAWVIRWNTF